jgi:DNA-binding NarL/FixJ family response regulator
MTGDAGAIVGRDEELERLGAFLELAAEAPAAALIEGEAGIGKTTLWRWTLDTARARGFTVLSASPAAAETALSFSVLDDLLEPVVGDVLPRLAPPRRAALEAALLLTADRRATPEVHAIAAGVRDAVRTVAEGAPVLIAIDDIQWIDRPSGAALAYAVRRLGDTRVGLAVARRSELGIRLPFELDRAFAPDRLERLRVNALSLGALNRIVAQRLDLRLPRPVLRRIVEAVGGNPFFALEIARAVRRSGAMPGVAEGVTVPDELHELVRDRLLALPAATRDLLATAAALSAPTAPLLEAATDAGDAALRTAIEADLVTLDGERLRFTHPLLRSAALRLLLPAERRALHGRLSAVVEDPEERARHLAMSVDGPDAAVAAALDDAARLASRRGAAHAAAELCELALHLTPPGAEHDSHERLLRALRHTWEAGDAERARALGERAVATAPEGRPRARALLALARLRTFQADVRAANAMMRDALDEAGDDPEVRAAAHAELAINMFLLRDSLPEAERHGELALQLAERLDHPARLVRPLTNLGMVRMCLGRADALEPVSRALAILDEVPDADLQRPDADLLRTGPRWDHACALLWSDRLEEATAEWHLLLEDAAASGEEGSMPYTLAHLALTRCLLGELEEAATLASEGHELSIETGLASEQSMLMAVRALVLAHQGEEERCRGLAREAIALGERRSLKIAVITGRSALALLDLSLGDFAGVKGELEEVERDVTAAGTGNPGGMRFVPDYVEALAGLGELDRAEAVLGRYEGHAVRLDRPAARAAALRCGGLIAAGRGDGERAQRAFAAALEQHERVTMPIDRARTLLAQGAMLRRANRKRAAREALEEALQVFDERGVKLFAAATARELGRISGRAASAGELTPSERRVAELVASGRTNREVAAALVLAERTVESHLSHIYRKLGVRSRAELAHRFKVP